MKKKKAEDAPNAPSDDARRSERREFLILLSGGAALAGVGTLAGCNSGRVIALASEIDTRSVSTTSDGPESS